MLKTLVALLLAVTLGVIPMALASLIMLGPEQTYVAWVLERANFRTLVQGSNRFVFDLLYVSLTVALGYLVWRFDKQLQSPRMPAAV